MAVVGCGHLGRIHARLLKSQDNVELVAVVDPAPAARDQVAADCAAQAQADCAALIGRIDAAVVATPTSCHHAVAQQLLSAGIHVLVEKPITTTVAEANQLIVLARRRQLVLQVGHVERFNPAWNAVAHQLDRPQYIEAVRAGAYSFRATDVSIVLDLMIHDLDLALSLAHSPVVDVEAMGLALFGPHEDLALARLKFANGCVALLKASRVNFQPQRSMLVFSHDAFASIDFTAGTAHLVRPTAPVLRGEIDLTCCPVDDRPRMQDAMFRDLMPRETVAVERTNAILDEQREFVAAVLGGPPVRVTGEQGRDALAVAHEILAAIAAHRWNSPDLPSVGPHPRVATPPRVQRHAA
jgi:predicted dehydrogenase